MKKLAYGIVGFIILMIIVSLCTREGSKPPITTEEVAEETIVVNQFEIQWELKEASVLLAIETDLPDAAVISVSVYRIYYEVGKDDVPYSRDYLSEIGPVSGWRTPREVSLDAEAWKTDLKEHQAEMASLDIGYEVAQIEDDVNIRAVLVSNQPESVFGGPGNPNLSSDIELNTEVNFLYPLEGPLPPSKSTTVAWNRLEIGKTYSLSRETMLMPEGRNPVDPVGALAKVRKIASGSEVTVIAVDREIPEQPWYNVTLVGSGGIDGWINGIALMGQDIITVE